MKFHLAHKPATYTRIMDDHVKNSNHDEFVLDIENLKFLAQVFGRYTHTYKVAYGHIFKKWVEKMPADSSRYELRKKFLEGFLPEK